MPQIDRFVGVDVSKARLDVHIAPDNQSFRVPNTTSGIAQMLSRLGPNDAVGCEASGGYEAELLLQLSEAGRPGWCLHPNDVHAFARLVGRRAKTDPLDAKAIAGALKVATTQRPPLELSRDSKEMRDAMTARSRLLQRIGETRGMLTRLGSGAVRDALEDDLRATKKTLERLEAEVARLIGADAQLAHKARLLRSAPGVGRVLAAELLSSLPELGALSSRQVASLVGVAPHPRQSGTTRRSGRCAGGRTRLRCTLYMAALALTAQRFRDQPLHQFYRRLRTKGKPFKVAIVAVMRKLLVVLNAMVRNDTTWVHEKGA